MSKRCALMICLTIVSVPTLACANFAQSNNQPQKGSNSAPAPSQEHKHSAPPEEGMVLEQFYKTLGASTVYSTKNAIKIHSTGNNIVIIAKAPKWDVIQYSRNTKKYVQADLEHTRPFMQRTFALFSGNVLALAPVVPVKPATICGIKATELQSPKSYYNQQLMRRRQKMCDSASPTTVHLTVSNDINFDPQSGAVAVKVLGLPTPPKANLGFPLYCSYEDMDNGKHFMLNTVSVKKKTIPPDTFDLPAGYTKVNEVAELLADPERDQELTDFLQERSHKH